MKPFGLQSIFFILLFVSSTLFTFAQTTVNFNSFTENQGLSTPHVEGELEFDVIKGPAGTCVNCMGIDINEGKDGGPGLDDANFEIEGIKGWKISKADNSSFQFISIWLQERGLAGISTSGTIKAFSGVSEAQFVKTGNEIHSFSNQNQIIVYSYALDTRPAAVNYVSVNARLQLNCIRPVYLAIAALNTPNSSLPIYLIQDTIGGCLFSVSHSYLSSYYSDYTISISENLPFRN